MELAWNTYKLVLDFINPFHAFSKSALRKGLIKEPSTFNIEESKVPYFWFRD